MPKSEVFRNEASVESAGCRDETISYLGHKTTQF